jgi:hypothetical protein
LAAMGAFVDAIAPGRPPHASILATRCSRSVRRRRA